MLAFAKSHFDNISGGNEKKNTQSSMPKSLNWSLPFSYCDKHFAQMSRLSLSFYMSRSSRPLFSDHDELKIKQVINLSI